MTKRLVLLIILALGLLSLVAFLRFGNSATEMLWNISQGGKWLLPLVSVSALIDSINPCAFSILLLTIAFLVSLDRVRPEIMKIGISYILGIFVIYIIIGLGILQTLHLFNTPHFMAKAGATLLIVLGAINLINKFFPAFPLKLQIPKIAHQKMATLMEKASLPSAFTLGALVGICEFPCTGGPYLMILGLLHDKTTYVTGLGYLVFYNLIFVLPLVIILLLASDKLVLSKVQAWRKAKLGNMKLVSGLAMVVLGIIIFLL